MELETIKLESGEFRTCITEKYRNRKPYVTPQRVVKAAIPGTIMSVLVKEGQSVKRGESLCILDSMKMNNVICADDNGTVSKIHIKAGDTVGKNELMIEFE